MSIFKPDLDLGCDEEPDPFVAECVDPSQIRSWIVDCEENHGTRCNTTEHQSATTATELKVIDVVDYCIVDAPPEVRYFALSYMWGGVTQMLLTIENGAELSLPGSLQQHWSMIPTVIQDAIHFVAALNERYLWVDSLCIVQNDVKMKHHQILQMGAIYNGAVASLVGATGVTANSGLAGVQPCTRDPEKQRIQYQNVFLVNPGPEQYTSMRKPWDNSPYIKLGRRMKGRPLDLNQQLMKSKYSSRAWTYQERILSRRCIYFMDGMVYYHCRSAIRGENKAAPYTRKSQDIRPLCLFMADPIFSGHPLRYQRTLGAVYAGIVTEYTRKELSFPLDILDAFSGISSAIGMLCSWRLVAGMPESLLDYALLWTPKEGSGRRCQQPDKTFPSWSWAGWQAEVDYDIILREEAGFEPYLAEMESLIYQCTIYDRDEPRIINSSVPGNEYFLKNANKAGISVQREISDRFSRMSGFPMPENVLVFQALTFPFKQCRIVKCKEGVPLFITARPSLSPIQRKTIILEIRSLSRNINYRASFYGAVADVLMITEPSNYDIVFLSISKGVGEDSDSWAPDRSVTNVMLIKWAGDFAERIAIGQIRGNVDIPGSSSDRPGLRIPPFDYFCWKTIPLI